MVGAQGLNHHGDVEQVDYPVIAREAKQSKSAALL